MVIRIISNSISLNLSLLHHSINGSSQTNTPRPAPLPLSRVITNRRIRLLHARQRPQTKLPVLLPGRSHPSPSSGPRRFNTLHPPNLPNQVRTP